MGEASSGHNLVLPSVGELVIGVAVAADDLVHHHLCRRPHLLAHIEGGLVICLEDIRNQLVNVIRWLCPLDGLDCTEEGGVSSALQSGNWVAGLQTVHPTKQLFIQLRIRHDNFN